LAVVEITGDQDDVDPLGAHQLHQGAEHGALLREQRRPVERAPEMPVGGVQQAHATHAIDGL